MTKLRRSIHLDYVTVKPYFTGKTMLIYAVVALLFTAMSANLFSGLGFGLMLATLFAGYPFALSEKSSLDALYVTLTVRRKTVVQGRYVFVLLLNIAALVLSTILAMAGMFIAKALGFSQGISAGNGHLASMLVLAAVFILIQAIQLPLYFKCGYTKARILVAAPFAVLMLCAIALMAMRNISAGLEAWFNKLSASGMAVPLLVLVIAAVVLVSYRLSVAFYNKREF